MNIISTYVKNPTKYVIKDDKSKEYVREKVRLNFDEQMVMAIVEEDGRKVTRHLIIKTKK